MGWFTSLWLDWMFWRVIERIPWELQAEDMELVFECAREFLNSPLVENGNLYIPQNEHDVRLPSDVVLALMRKPEVYQHEAQRAYQENRDFLALAQIPFTKEYWIRRLIFAKINMEAKKFGGFITQEKCNCVVNRILHRFDEVRRMKVVSH